MANKQPPKAFREGRDLLWHFYGFSRKRDPDRYIQKDQFRQDVYRFIVIQLHLPIDELVRSFLFEKVKLEARHKGQSHEQIVDYVFDLRTRSVVDMALKRHVLSTEGHRRLVELNEIRNKCAHNWELHSFTVAERVKNEKTEIEPRIEFDGKSLLTPKVMKRYFLPLYSDIYLELFGVHYGVYEGGRTYTDTRLEAVNDLS